MPRPKVSYRTTSKSTYLRFCAAHPEIKISYRKWNEVIRTFNAGFRDYILETGDKCKLPYGFGDFSICKKKKRKFREVNGEQKIALPINWKATRERGKRIYHLNDHTEGYGFKWYWFKSSLMLRGAKFLVFKPCRKASRKITEYINKSPYYQHIYREWEMKK